MDAPHEIVLVVDATNGQNALQQIKAFNDALTLTALVVTKLDGTAKGGILAAMSMSTRVPVAFIGVGEKWATCALSAPANLPTPWLESTLTETKPHDPI